VLIVFCNALVLRGLKGLTVVFKPRTKLHPNFVQDFDTTRILI
jgi:hypothetical protein